MLDLLRGVSERGRPASYLVESGRLFGFTENTVRVTLSRLVNRGLLACPERGRYRLADQTDHLQSFIERWRLGENRVRQWKPGTWVLAVLSKRAASSLWALDALGFREVNPHLFVRPDNLAVTLTELTQLAIGIGVGMDVLLLEGQLAGEAAWMSLWNPENLNNGYRDIVKRLDSSSKKLLGLSMGEAQLESFRLGGEAIKLLAKDPLLPAEVIDVKAREKFCQLLMDYNRAGKDIWASAGELHHTMPVRQLVRA